MLKKVLGFILVVLRNISQFVELVAKSLQKEVQIVEVMNGISFSQSNFHLRDISLQKKMIIRYHRVPLFFQGLSKEMTKKSCVFSERRPFTLVCNGLHIICVALCVVCWRRYFLPYFSKKKS